MAVWRGVKAGAFVAAVVFVGAVMLSRTPYRPDAAIAVAQNFVAAASAGRFGDAMPLVDPAVPIGRDRALLEAAAQRELCRLDRMTSTSPSQTHGNRWRRQLAGREADEPEVRVEFEGACLVGVVVRRVGPDDWRVVRFASHAG